jgi:hypothetical protein
MTITKWPAIGNCHRRIRPAPAVPPQDSCVRLAWQSNVRGRTDPRRGKAGTPMTPLRVPGARCNNDRTAWMKWASSRTDSLRRRFPAAVTEKHFGPTSKSTTRTGRSVHPGCPPVHRTRWCPSSAKSAGASIGKARTARGLSRVHFHDLRHFSLTMAVATGASTGELMDRRGHSSPSAALGNQYATEDRDRAIAEALSGVVPKADLVPSESAGASPWRQQRQQRHRPGRGSGSHPV